METIPEGDGDEEDEDGEDDAQGKGVNATKGRGGAKGEVIGSIPVACIFFGFWNR